MVKSIMALAAVSLSLQATAQTNPGQGVGLSTDKARMSYAVGVQIGTSLQPQRGDMDQSALTTGLLDALAARKLKMSDVQLRNMLSRFLSEQRLKQAALDRQAGPANAVRGEAFLTANRSRPGVVTLPDGLQYQILKPGDGKKPAATDTVTVHYRGTLIDGTEFDNSYKRGEPATFGVKGVIAGWTEALQMMPAGSKWRIFIPSRLAYGPRSAGPTIGPNSVLIFDLELLSIKAS